MTLFEWNLFCDECELFDIKQTKNHRAKDHYFLVLEDDIIPYDKVLWAIAMGTDK